VGGSGRSGSGYLAPSGRTGWGLISTASTGTGRISAGRLSPSVRSPKPINVEYSHFDPGVAVASFNTPGAFSIVCGSRLITYNFTAMPNKHSNSLSRQREGYLGDRSALLEVGWGSAGNLGCGGRLCGDMGEHVLVGACGDRRWGRRVRAEDKGGGRWAWRPERNYRHALRPQEEGSWRHWGMYGRLCRPEVSRYTSMFPFVVDSPTSSTWSQ